MNERCSVKTVIIAGVFKELFIAAVMAGDEACYVSC